MNLTKHFGLPITGNGVKRGVDILKRPFWEHSFVKVHTNGVVRLQVVTENTFHQSVCT